MEIQTYKFDKDHFNKIRKWNYGSDWPVVYLIEDGKELYVGETISAFNRVNQHYANERRRSLHRIHLFTDEEYNKSAALDIESSLIQYMAADGRFRLQNGNQGLQNHNYFDRERYQAKFEIIWEELRKRRMANNSLVHIKNSNLFKYSPYKTLNLEQCEIAERLYRDISMAISNTYIIKGGPGTGKTILAAYLFKLLKDKDETKDKRMALVVPMTSLRTTMKRVFKNIKGLNAGMIIGPSEIHKGYDILIVDEAHRLHRRKNIPNFGSFDRINQKLGLDNDGTELDWIMKSSAIQVLFYDKNQSVRPSDVRSEDVERLKAKEFELHEQMRVGMGDEGKIYLDLVDSIFEVQTIGKVKFKHYDFRLYDDIQKIVDAVKSQDKAHGLSRMISGLSWPWISKENPSDYDIVINKTKLRWNTVSHDWVNSPNAVNEVGCIHTVQGYDLNYAGVIIGPELSFDHKRKKFVVYPEKYMDANGRRGVDDPKELERYIINIYKTLLSRAMKGTFIYVVDEELRKYFRQTFANVK